MIDFTKISIIFLFILCAIFIITHGNFFVDLFKFMRVISIILIIVCGMYIGIQYLATAIFGIYNAYGGGIGAAWGIITVIFMIITLPIFGKIITERFVDVPRNDPEKYYFEIQVRDYEYGMYAGFWLLLGFLFFAIGYFYLTFVSKV